MMRQNNIRTAGSSGAWDWLKKHVLRTSRGEPHERPVRILVDRGGITVDASALSDVDELLLMVHRRPGKPQ
jgi:hypothetical protein